jgi:hypothetical protein
MATPVPVILLSQQTMSEVLADIPAQPQTIIPLSGKELLRQAEEERARQEKEHADKFKEERARKAKEAVLTPTELATSAYQTPLSSEGARSSKSPTLPPETVVALKSTKLSASWRFVLLGLAGLVILALASGIAWLTVHHASPIGSITEFPIPTANSLPGEITAGPDGNLWFTEDDGGKIGLITSGK